MLVCYTDDESSADEGDSPKKAKDKDKKHIWNHGSEFKLLDLQKWFILAGYNFSGLLHEFVIYCIGHDGNLFSNDI